MPKPTINQVAGQLTDPMLSDNFQLEIPNVPSNSGASRPLLLQCKSAAKPGMTIESVEAALFGHALQFGGRLTYSHEMAVSYIETFDGGILTILEGWVELVRNHLTQHGSFKKDYASTGKLTIFDQTGAVVSVYEMQNFWPTGTPEVNFDGSSATLIEHSVTFKYDWVEKTR